MLINKYDEWSLVHSQAKTPMVLCIVHGGKDSEEDRYMIGLLPNLTELTLIVSIYTYNYLDPASIVSTLACIIL